MAESTKAFDYRASLIKVQGGRTYLPVAARIVWFRQEHPDWSILTQIVEYNREKQYATFRCDIADETGRIIAQGTKTEDVKGFGDYAEKAETGAVGRALALCGFGTAFAPELDETAGKDGPRYADGPRGGQGSDRQPQGQVGGGHPAARPAATFRPPTGRDEDYQPLTSPAETDPQDDAEDDPFADDLPASRTTRDGTPAAERTPPDQRQAPAGAPPACVQCGKALTKAQSELSIRNYGEALCPADQKGKNRNT